jgi:hypothetical protein
VRKTGAELLVDVLVDPGVETAYGLPGIGGTNNGTGHCADPGVSGDIEGRTHVIGDDHRKVAEQLGEFFAQVRLNLPKKENGSGDRSSQAAV